MIQEFPSQDANAVEARTDAYNLESSASISASKSKFDKEYGELILKAREDGVELERVGAYLPKHRVRRAANSRPPIGWISATIQLLSGNFLQTRTEEASVHPEGIQKFVFDQNANIAVVCALLLSLFMPMAIGYSADIHERKFLHSGTDIAESWFAKKFDQGDIEVMNLWFTEISGVSYWVSAVGFMMGALNSIYILLCANELGTDKNVSEFLGRMKWGMRIPYMFWTLAQAWFFGVLLRLLSTMKTGWALVLLGIVISLAVAVLLGVSMVRTVKCCVNTVRDFEVFEPLSLTPEEAHADVEAYIKEAGTSATLQDCLDAMRGRTPGNTPVPLSTNSVIFAKMAYHERMSTIMGLSVNFETLFAMATL
eukprot:TRINITY_DN23702_c0_g1_i1.p1 TRINITY_DN23702_c0_g1~~TRINITY_DN23702_c0_g1_i1.p1  ORF type:complete len:368 (+),score=51.05 TRINITY_DN23702_c0_g1_i1:60-1163(+)